MASTLIISCLSQKGGVGKSTISRLVATAYATHHWRVKIADLNVKQKTSVDWSALRMLAGVEPEVTAEAFVRVKPALEQIYDLLVFDGKPDTESETLDAAKISTLVIVPTGPTLDDLKPQINFAREMLLRGIDRQKIFFIINKTTDSTIATNDARENIQAAGFAVAQTDIPIKVGYQMAQNMGRAISETSFRKLNERAELLAAEIVAKVDKITGLKK